jgi:predicted DNA-binding transcriptional regulator AlpA
MITNEQKEKFIEYLSEKPVITYAAQKAGIARSTIYRLLETDLDLNTKYRNAMRKGKSHISDLAVSKMINQISGGNFGAIKYWLAKNHPTYMEKDTYNRYLNEQKTEKRTGVSRVIDLLEYLELWKKKNPEKNFGDEGGDLPTQKDIEEPEDFTDPENIHPDHKISV